VTTFSGWRGARRGRDGERRVGQRGAGWGAWGDGRDDAECVRRTATRHRNAGNRQASREIFLREMEETYKEAGLLGQYDSTQA
jgi:hypothetical protein